MKLKFLPSSTSTCIAKAEQIILEYLSWKKIHPTTASSQARTTSFDFHKLVAPQLTTEQWTKFLYILHNKEGINYHVDKHRKPSTHKPQVVPSITSKRLVIQEEMSETLGRGIIQPSQYSWPSPVVPVMKSGRMEESITQYCIMHHPLSKRWWITCCAT